MFSCVSWWCPKVYNEAFADCGTGIAALPTNSYQGPEKNIFIKLG